MRRLLALVIPQFTGSTACFEKTRLLAVCCKWFGYSLGITLNFTDLEDNSK